MENVTKGVCRWFLWLMVCRSLISAKTSYKVLIKTIAKVRYLKLMSRILRNYKKSQQLSTIFFTRKNESWKMKKSSV